MQQFELAAQLTRASRTAQSLAAEQAVVDLAPTVCRVASALQELYSKENLPTEAAREFVPRSFCARVGSTTGRK